MAQQNERALCGSWHCVTSFLGFSLWLGFLNSWQGKAHLDINKNKQILVINHKMTAYGG